MKKNGILKNTLAEMQTNRNASQADSMLASNFDSNTPQQVYPKKKLGIFELSTNTR
jgi:hypothetical protein